MKRKFIPYDPKLKALARKLRQDMTFSDQEGSTSSITITLTGTQDCFSSIAIIASVWH